MAPLKFEDNVREKLEEREINPSKDSWSRLANKLDEQEAGSKSKFWWYAAASIVGLILLSTLFFKNIAIDSEMNPDIVDTEVEEVKKVEKKDPLKYNNDQIEQDFKQSDIVDVQINSKESSQKQEQEQEQNQIPTKKAKKQNKIKTNIQKQQTVVVADISEEKKNLDITKKEDLILIQDNAINPQIINNKVADVIAQVKTLQAKNNQVTEEEIDALLRKAQQEITIQKIISSNTVSATALLQDVEMELDETFKDKVYEALLAGFEKVKTAVVERDN